MYTVVAYSQLEKLHTLLSKLIFREQLFLEMLYTFVVLLCLYLVELQQNPSSIFWQTYKTRKIFMET